MQDQIMSLEFPVEVSRIARSYFENDRDFTLYQKLKCLRAVREHNLTCLPENRLESAQIVEAEMELARLENDNPRKYKKLSSLCN